VRDAPVTTRVGGHAVPVRGVHPSIGVFVTGARGARERGIYCFWTAVLARPWLAGYHKRKRARWIRTCTVRARAMQPAGERFERMGREMKTARSVAARREYGVWWEGIFERGQQIAYIRPATFAEMRRWCAGHGADARGLHAAWVGPPKPPLTREPAPLTAAERAWEGWG